MSMIGTFFYQHKVVFVNEFVNENLYCFAVFSKSKAFHGIIFKEKSFTTTFCKPWKLFVNTELFSFLPVPKGSNGFKAYTMCTCAVGQHLCNAIKYSYLFPANQISCQKQLSCPFLKLSHLIKCVFEIVQAMQKKVVFEIHVIVHDFRLYTIAWQ